MYLIQREHRRRQRQAGKIRLRQQLEGEEEELDREPTAPDQGYQVDKLEEGEIAHNQKSDNEKSFRQREHRKLPKIPIVDAPPTSLQQQQPSSASAAASAITAATAKMGSKGSSSYKNDLDPYYQTVVEDLDSGNHSNLILYFLAMVMVYEVIRRALGTATHRMLSIWWRKRTKESSSDNDQTNSDCHSTSIIDPINNKVQQRRARLIGAPWVKDRHRTSGR